MSRPEVKRPNRKKRLRITLIAAAVAVLVFGYTPPGKAMWAALMRAAGLAHFTASLPEDALHVHVIDVGKADAILLESPDANVLVDCGTAEAAEDVLRYLAARGIDRLDAVWISHPDDDHCGGLSAVLQTVPADAVVESPVGESISGMTALPQAVPLRRAAVGERYAYGAMTFEVLGPLQDYAESNNDSTVFRLQYDGFSMLFCGDMEAQAERDLLAGGAALRTDVLKVAHHGSDTSTSAALLEAVQPRYAVVSSGEDRSMLPRNAVLQRLHTAGAEIFRTDTDDAVVFSAADGKISVITENGRSAACAEP